MFRTVWRPSSSRSPCQGATPLLVCDRKTMLGMIVLEDIVKPGMRDRFVRLRAMGLRTVMVTGDNPLTAAAIAAQAGVDDFIAQATPEAKLAYIRKEQATGKLVAMMGDGTNDAPALAQADVGVAMNSGTQAAKEAGNMVDLDSDPTKLIEVVEIGKQLLMTRSALTTFSIANDLAKYFAIVPAMFAATLPWLKAFDVMNLHSANSAILSAVIFNALIIPALIPIALKGVTYRPVGADALLRRNLLDLGPRRRHRAVHRHQGDRPGARWHPHLIKTYSWLEFCTPLAPICKKGVNYRATSTSPISGFSALTLILCSVVYPSASLVDRADRLPLSGQRQPHHGRRRKSQSALGSSPSSSPAMSIFSRARPPSATTGGLGRLQLGREQPQAARPRRPAARAHRSLSLAGRTWTGTLVGDDVEKWFRARTIRRRAINAATSRREWASKNSTLLGDWATVVRHDQGLHQAMGQGSSGSCSTHGRRRIPTAKRTGSRRTRPVLLRPRHRRQLRRVASGQWPCTVDVKKGRQGREG